MVTSRPACRPRVGSVGRVLDGVEVRLVDADGDDVLDGDAGEVWVRGPNVFQGYWNDPEATARVLAPTAGCAPATSPPSTTTATSTSSTGPRT